MKNNTQPALKERIEKALEDFTKGRASMHVPPLDTDVDVVLAECSDRLSELKARCAALAAENAGLNKFIVQSCYVFDGEQGELSDAYICAIDGRMPQTQVTDAFWDEVRAQGVDSAINTVIAMMNHQHPVTSKAIDIMRVHAYQIRKGVQS